MALQYSIAPEIFERFPAYCRGVVLATGLDNHGARPELEAQLRAAERALGEQLTLDTVATHPRLLAWREAYRSVGIKPSEFRPSVEAMARRCLRGEQLPAINPLVDLGNLFSLRYLSPVGAHAIDVLRSSIALRPASGTEVFIPFGGESVEHPAPGEWIFTEGEQVLTRRWTWRQARHTLVEAGTRAVEINVDGLSPVTRDEVERICRSLAEAVGVNCGGKTSWHILDRAHPVMELP
jgi:DNA/RNA-binding domain of Phe-tRNA-synthetase-like protein